MSRGLSSNVNTQLRSEGYHPVWLFEFEDVNGNVYKYCDLDVPLFTTDSDGPSGMFEPLGFTISNINYTLSNVMDRCEVEVDNLDSVMSAIFLDTGIEEQTATIYLSLLNASGGIIESFEIFTGEIDEFELDEEKLKLTIGSIFTRWAEQSHEKHSSSCRWKVFKGTECRYPGVETYCDRSYKRCQELTNTDNFGGFRFLPEYTKKTLWWGPTPSEQRANQR